MAQKINPRLLRQHKQLLPVFSFYAKKTFGTLLGTLLWNSKNLIAWQKQTSNLMVQTRRKALKKGALMFCNYWQKGTAYNFAENLIYVRTLPKTLQASYNVLFPKVKKTKSRTLVKKNTKTKKINVH